MLVLRLCSVMVMSQDVVDTRQMLYKYMILWKLCGHKSIDTVQHPQPHSHVYDEEWNLHSYG